MLSKSTVCTSVFSGMNDSQSTTCDYHNLFFLGKTEFTKVTHSQFPTTSSRKHHVGTGHMQPLFDCLCHSTRYLPRTHPPGGTQATANSHRLYNIFWGINKDLYH